MKTPNVVLCIVIISLHLAQCIGDTSNDGNRIGSSTNATAGSVMGIDKSGNGGGDAGGNGANGGNDTNSTDESMDFDKNAQSTGIDDNDSNGDAMTICNKTFTIPIGRFYGGFSISIDFRRSNFMVLISCRIFH